MWRPRVRRWQAGSSQLKKWREKYKVMRSEEVEGAVRLWFGRPLLLPDSGRDDAGAMARALVAGSGSTHKDKDVPAPRLHGCALSKSCRSCTLLLRQGGEHRLVEFLQATLAHGGQAEEESATGEAGWAGSGSGAAGAGRAHLWLGVFWFLLVSSPQAVKTFSGAP